MSKIIVGIDGSERSADAVSFAAHLARRARADLMLAIAYPYDDDVAHVDTALRHRLREAAQETLDRLHGHVPFGVATITRTIADRSAARALHTLAIRERASLIVIGSSHRGAVGRVFAGTTADRLMHGAPCPVAVVPRAGASTGLGTIAVGWDAKPESAAALSAAAAVARAAAAELRVVAVQDSGAPGRDEVEQAIAGLPEAVRAEPVILQGDPVLALVGQSEAVDLLVLGSRGYGPHRAVLLGGVSGRVLRNAACPVIVVPRGVAAPLEDLFRPALLRATPPAI